MLSLTRSSVWAILILFLLYAQLSFAQKATLKREIGELITQAASQFQTNAPEALRLLAKAQEKNQALNNDSLRLEIEKNKGNAYWYFGDYKSSLTHFLVAEEMAQRIGDQLNLAKMKSNVGLVYSNLSEYEKAEAYYAESIALLGHISGNERTVANIYNSLAVLKRKTGKLEEGLSYLEKALELMRADGYEEGVAQTLSNMGSNYIDRGLYHKAEQLFKLSLAQSEKINSISGITTNYIKLGTVALRTNRCNEALNWFEKGLAIAEQNKRRPLIRDFTEKLAEANACLGRYQKAYEWKAAFSALKDSVNKDAHLLEINKIHQRNEIERILKENEYLSRINQLNEKTIYSQKLFVWLLIVAGTLMVVAIVDLRRTRKRLREQNITLGENAQLIVNQSKELERLSESKIQQIIDNALDAVIGMDERGIIVSWSKRAEEIFGWRDTEVLGKRLGETIVPEQHRKRHEEGYQRYLLSGKSRIMNSVVGISAIRKTGEEFPVELIVTRVEYNGRILFNSFIRDVTEKKKAEMELEESRQKVFDTLREKQELIEAQKQELELRVEERTTEIKMKNESLLLANEEIQRQRDEVIAARDYLQQVLNDLKATQAQLIQQEKLASLGQLTAGIAHEIKNPLNFVNNFSAVSLELMEEAVQELEKLGDEARSTEIPFILNDVKTNLQKIYEHGSRADRIVKSMLQHSRAGHAEKEPTQLNQFLREFTNLSFHGMRSGSKRIECDIIFDLDEQITEIPLIAQDFSRVILNLTSNAFDTLWEKKQQDSSFHPKLIVRSKKEKKHIRIEVEDNGLGISDEIQDKILQPFFTTKKGTDGTGLGLSITHDIIKAHGGQLDISSKPGATCFIITLKG